ncbi:hypothetical protein Tco_0931794 [Tanacetum coccineum]
MSTLTFADTHNMVAFLEKSSKSDGFHEIIDFLNANQIRYALTVNPTIYTSCIEQIWSAANAKTDNGERQIQALIDKKKVIIMETSIRSDLHLEDAGGIDCLPTATIFEELARMSDEDRMQLNDLMVLCTKLKKQVLDLDKAKSDQAIKIASLKNRVEKLEKRRKFRTTKVGTARRTRSYNDSLGAQEDASKQGRRIEDLDADVEMFVDVTTGKKEEQSTKIDDMKVSTADPVTIVGEAVTTVGVEDSVSPTIPVSSATTVEETLAQTLMEIKAAKPKSITIAANTRPKAKGIIFHDQEKQVYMSEPIVSVTQPSFKDKGKGIIQEPERPLKKKDQVVLDEYLARNLQAQLEAKLLEEERLARKKEEEANIALIESWDNTQAMMEAEFELV